MGTTFDAASRDTREIVLSHATWRRFLAADPAVVGSSLTLDGERYRVTGVMPAAFRFPTPEAAFWVPLLLDAGGSRGMILPAIGRIRSGATLPAVADEGRRALADEDGRRVKQTLIVRTLQDQFLGGDAACSGFCSPRQRGRGDRDDERRAAAAGARRRPGAGDCSIRLALGAGRVQLARQLFVEALTLALAGGAAGVLLAAGCCACCLWSAPPEIPRLDEAALDPPVLVFALALTAAACVVFGAPLRRPDDRGRSGARAGGAGAESRLFGGRTPRRRMNALAAGRARIDDGAAGRRRPAAAIVRGARPRRSGVHSARRAGAARQPAGGALSRARRRGWHSTSVCSNELRQLDGCRRRRR